MPSSLEKNHNVWSSGPSLEDLLREEPFRFNFFQAVRVLERLAPHKRAVGGNHPPEEECVRFRTHLSLVFPPSDLVEVLPPRSEDGPPRLTVAFFGLTGPSGALPRFYTELMLERARQKDHTLREFLDLFSHRLLSLFYRAWEKYQFHIGHERAERIGQRDFADDLSRLRAFVTETRPRLDLVSQNLLDLTGMGTPSLRYQASVRERLAPRSTVADLTVRHYAGLLSQQHRSAAGLEGLLRDFFGIAADVLQFVPQWLALEADSQTQLADGGNTELGGTALIGKRFRDLQGKFRLRLGPLSYEEFLDFLPSGTAYRKIADLARLYAGPTFDMDCQLVLRAKEVPWCQFSRDTQRGPRLGWNTWLRRNEFTQDAEDALLALHPGKDDI